jgi:hypothetical protein
MAVVVIREFEATPEEYDLVNQKLGEETPEGGSSTRLVIWAEAR